MNVLNAQTYKAMLLQAADRILRCEPVLTKIDSAIGDGDHGILICGTGIGETEEEKESSLKPKNDLCRMQRSFFFFSVLLSDKGIIRRIFFDADKPLHFHMQVVLLPERRNGAHHGGRMVPVDRLLVFPGVDQKDRLRVISRKVVFIAEISVFPADGIRGSAFFHFFGKLPGIAVFAPIKQVDGDHRRLLCRNSVFFWRPHPGLPHAAKEGRS